jgi:uncharacterized lipoprotein YmbA
MKYFLIIFIVMLAACSSQPPQQHSYLLRSPSTLESRALSEAPAIGLGTVHVANYIDQPGIVLETANGQVHAARHHLWAEPLRASLRRYLVTEISSNIDQDIADSSRLPSVEKRIEVQIDQFHGTPNGNARLVAYWQIISGADSQSYQFSDQQTLAADGYDALVAAQTTLLSRLAAAISQSIN